MYECKIWGEVSARAGNETLINTLIEKGTKETEGIWSWGLESPWNPQAGMPALRDWQFAIFNFSGAMLAFLHGA